MEQPIGFKVGDIIFNDHSAFVPSVAHHLHNNFKRDLQPCEVISLVDSPYSYVEVQFYSPKEAWLIEPKYLRMANDKERSLFLFLKGING